MGGRMTAGSIAALAGFVLISFVPAAVGGLFGPGDWYRTLAKPAWTPPGWIFGPVWTLLYLSMGVAAWMVWTRAGLRGAWVALLLFAVQLVLNGAWSWLFFGLHSPGLAFLDIVLLWLAIAATIVAFWIVRPAAALVLVPYLLWVSFATALNLAIWRLNA